ncbi:hypothetical protein D3C85_483310 [compost metagenome]
MSDKMVITPEILSMVMKWAERRVLASLGVTDEMLADYPEVSPSTLISLSPAHEASLGEFDRAYNAWYNLHLKVARSGILTASDSAELVKLSILKDQKREALLVMTA